MKAACYVPKAVKDGSFRGTVTVSLLTFKERFALVNEADIAKENGKHTEFLVELVEKSKERVLSVNLERVSDGEKFTDVGDLEYGTDCHAILVDVATWLLNGDEKSGKNVAPSSESKSAQ